MRNMAQLEAGQTQDFLRVYTFDEAISETGYGRFHYKVCFACTLIILCVGFQNGLSSYIFSPAQCDLNFESQDLGLLNVSFLLGGTISVFFWGVIADLKGRKKILMLTILLDALITVWCSFVRTFNGALICRFLNGVLIGCPGSVTFTYLAEFHGPNLRAKSVCYSGVAFIAGWVLLPILAFLILPLQVEMSIFHLPYAPWRIFLAIIAALEIVAGLCLLKLPESPKFLHDQGCGDEALDILTDMYCKNARKDGREFPVKRLGSNITLQKDVHLLKYQGKNARLLHDTVIQLKKLFSMEFRVKTLLVCSITLCNMFGYFGLGLWLPEFFIRFENHYLLHPNESTSFADLTFSDNGESASNCSFNFDANIFRNTVLVATSALLTNTLAGWLAGRVSIRNLTLTAMSFGALSSLSIYWIRSSLGVLIVSSIFQSAMATGNIVIGSIAVDQFPTSIGAMALCLSMAAGRIGAVASNILFSVLLGKHNGAVIFTVSAVLLLGAVLCFPISSYNESVHTSIGLADITPIKQQERYDCKKRNA